MTATINTINALTLISNTIESINFSVITDTEDVTDPSFLAEIEIDLKYNNLIESLNQFTASYNIKQDVVESYFKVWKQNLKASSEELDQIVIKSNLNE